MPRSRLIAGRALLVLASTGLALSGAEWAYRHQREASGSPDGGDEDWYQRYRTMNETLYQRSTDPELVYEPVPSSRMEMEYGLAEFNASRLREADETASEPAPGTTRVVVLGDSLVWSEYLPTYAAIPQRAEEALGAGFEVLNAGVSGYDTAEEARWYELAVRPLHPDVVVLVYCMNDMMIMSGPFERFAEGEARAAKDAQDAFFEAAAPVRRETLDGVIDRREREATFRLLARGLGIFERWRFSRAYIDEYLLVANDERRRARLHEALSRLGAAIREDGALPILVISPVLESWEAYRWSALHELVRAEGEGAGFTVVDPLSDLRGEYDADVLRMGTDNLHYGRTGAQVFGAVIADAVREALP